MTTIASVLACSRASIGYYEKADGTLVQFGNNVLRYGTNGLLVEESRINTVLRSQDLANASWTKYNASGISNAVAAPDGTTTASFLREDNGTTSHGASQAIAGALVNGASYTASIYVKPNGRTKIRFHVYSNAYLKLCEFDLTGAGSVILGAPGRVSALANGWYKLSMTGVAPSNAAISEYYIAPLDAGATDVYAGDSVSGIYVWGAQFEAGASPTSYIPTTSSSATRSADDVTMSGVNFSWYKTTGGTLCVQSQIPVKAGAYCGLAELNDGTVNNLAQMLLTTSTGNNRATVTQATVTQADLTSGAAPADGVTSKFALAFQENDFVSVKDGGTPQADSSGGLPVVTTLHIGKVNNGGLFANGYIRRLTFFPNRISNANLQALTT